MRDTQVNLKLLIFMYQVLEIWLSKSLRVSDDTIHCTDPAVYPAVLGGAKEETVAGGVGNVAVAHALSEIELD